MHYSFGATLRDRGIVNFRLWAPGAASVELELENEAHVMRPVGDGFHELERACEPGSRYRYRVGPDLFVPDPASRLQAGDVHDASIVVDTESYSWRHDGWRGRPWTETVLYELHVGLAGGFRGVQAMLPALANLGITAIELMPIADFPGARNWGYDGVLPYAPDGAYGTPDELRALIDEAHGLNVMVFLDVVYNHFGPDGNYLSAYAPDFYREDVKTPWGPAIDFRKPQVRAFFAENALYWLREYRFDGLRLDAVHAISETDWLPEMARFVRQNLDPARYVHLVLENDDNNARLLKQGFDAQWNDDAHHILHSMLTGEIQGYYTSYRDDPTRKLARCLAEGFIYQGEPSPWRNGEPRGEPSADLPPHAFVFFLQNHDQTGNRALGERLISLCAGKTDALKAAVALQLLTPHIPMLFMGEEYGATAPFLYFTSFEDPDLAQAVRDGRRKEFAGFSAFSDPSTRERIPDPNDEITWSQSKVISDPADKNAASWLIYYRHLLGLRAEYVTPHLAGARNVSVQVLGDRCLAASWELGNGDVLSLYCNLSEEDLALPAGVLHASESVIFESSETPGKGLAEECVRAYSTTATLVADAGAAVHPKEMP